MKEVEKALSWCDNESISISPNNKFLFLNYMDPPEKMTEYMIYNFETETLISA
jgi:lysine/ornithine N-monooxygenase